MSKTLLTFAVLATLLWTNEASACRRLPGTPEPANDTGRDWAIAISAFGVANTALLSVQLAEGDALFGPELAGFELALGISQSVLSSVLVVSGTLSGLSSCDTDPWQGYGMPAALALAVTSGWLIAHAIWSLSAARQSQVLPTLTIDPQGASLGLVGRF